MKKILITILFVLLCTSANASQNWNSSVSHENRNREFKVFVPSFYGKKPLPLVIVLHGGGGNKNQIERHSKFSKLAKKKGFIAAYPQGLEKQWNDGREVPGSKAHTLKIDDTGFIKKMIAAIRKKYKIDTTRIYVCGISNGGFMSMRLACDMADTFAAAGIVCAALNPYLAKTANPKTKISILIMNVTADPLVPYQGGDVSLFGKARGKVLPTEDTVKYWLSWNNCGGKPFVAGINPDTTDGTEIQKYIYSCGSAEVILYKIIGGGHNWPGAAQYLPEKIIGKTSRDINATESLWEFFKRHRK